MRLDEQDVRILSELSHDARVSNVELARRVGLSPSGCLDRVRRLESRGVLTGSHAEIAPAAVGVGLQALVAVKLKRHTRKAVGAFRAHALGLEEVVSVFHVTGEFDFYVHVAARDMEHLRDFGLDALTTRPEVQHIRTSLMFEAVTRPGWPGLRQTGSR